LLVALAARPKPLPEELRRGRQGAVRWLLLPEEASQYAHLQNATSARRLHRRLLGAPQTRGPTPPANTLAQERFFERVADGRQLYLEETCAAA